MRTERWAIAIVIISVAAMAQTPRFEVASIKPTDPNYQGAMMRPVAGGIEMKGFNLKAMIVTAWRVQPFQITGGPKWLGDDRFDIVAKAATPILPREMPALLRALLADRFHLVVRQETREMPVYDLVLARKDGKLGPQMTVSTCPTYNAEHPASDRKPQDAGCGGSSGGPDRVKVRGGELTGLVSMLSSQLERKVIDKTGLSGKFDMQLKWSADQGADGGPTVFTAMEEQLGLKLVSSKGPVEMLAIERVEKPSEN